MKDIKEIKDIIAKNIINLRKKNGLTQNEFASKLNYSDNAVSRWERGEVTPNIETLVQMADIFGVSVNSLIEENATKTWTMQDKKQLIGKLSIMLLYVSLVWFVAVIGFFYAELIFNKNLWTLFVWAVPASCLVMCLFHFYWRNTIYKFVMFSAFLWTFLASFYLQFLTYNLWLIFIIGLPVQFALSIWTFLTPKTKK